MLKLWENPMLSIADRLEAASGEIERLHGLMDAARNAVEKANAQAERFEREWYLRGDAAESALAPLRQAFDALEATADSDLDFEDEEEEAQYAPEQFAARKIMVAIELLTPNAEVRGATPTG